MRKIIGIITICCLLITVFSGCGLLQTLGFQDKDNDELHPVSSIVMNEEEAKKLTDKVPIHLYFANENNTKLKLEVRYIPVAEAKKSVNNLATLILNELIKGPQASTGYKATIPAGTKLKARIKIDGGVATVDFSKEFVDKHPGGKIAEQLTIYSVVNSLTEVKDIQKVRFTIDGKKRSEYKGHFKFDSAFPRAEALISKEITNPGSGTSTDSKDNSKDNKENSNAKKDDKKSSEDAEDSVVNGSFNEGALIDSNGDLLE